MADFYTFTLRANVPVQVPVRGKVILVDDIIGANSITITPLQNGGSTRPMPNRRRAFKCWVDYDGVTLESAVDCTVHIWLSMKDVSLGFADGATVNVLGQVQVTNDATRRIPVQVDGSVINVNAVPFSYMTLADLPPVAVGVAAVKVSDDATLKRLRIRNMSETAKIALGGQGVTLNSAIVIMPGEIFIEDDAAGAAWYAVASEAGAQVAILGVK